MEDPMPDFAQLLRRIVREEVRSALADMIPVDAGPLLTYKQAAESSMPGGGRPGTRGSH